MTGTTALDADAAEKLTAEELIRLPSIAKQMTEGGKQVKAYGKKLENKYGNLRLKKFVVVSLGFERICFQALQ